MKITFTLYYHYLFCVCIEINKLILQVYAKHYAVVKVRAKVQYMKLEPHSCLFAVPNRQAVRDPDVLESGLKIFPLR